MKKKSIKKLPSSVICPKCGEKNSFYISKTGKKKGILTGEYIYESFFNPNHGYHYECYTCGYKWEEEIRERTIGEILHHKFLKNDKEK